jgi:hypothetical protein
MAHQLASALASLSPLSYFHGGGDVDKILHMSFLKARVGRLSKDGVRLQRRSILKLHGRFSRSST